jgi:ADP-ribosylglycohydrolase
MGFTLFTAGIALQIVGEGAGFEEGVLHTISLGGDTDTNAAVTGALLGAAFGDTAIPAPWLNKLAEREAIKSEAGALASLL